MLKQHTYMEIIYINSLGNKTKTQEIPGGEEKQRGGKGGEEKQDVFQTVCFLLIVRLPQNSQNWGAGGMFPLNQKTQERNGC